MTLPVLPVEGESPWYSKRAAFDAAVRAAMEGRLTEANLITLIEENAPAGTPTALGSMIAGATAKATPIDADSVALADSAASNVVKKLTWANIKATLKTYFDTLYSASGHTHSAVAGVTISGTPAAGKVLTATTSSAASWQDAIAGGFLVLGPSDPIPVGTPSSTIIFRTAA